MFTVNQQKNIERIHEAAFNRITRVLESTGIALNVEFETALFLLSATSIVFAEKPEIMDAVASAARNVTIPHTDGKASRETIDKTLRLYGKTVSERITPNAFWATTSIEKFCTEPILRAIVVFGDILVYPECVDNYDACPWPIFSFFDTARFSRIFMSRVTPEIGQFLRDIIDVVEEAESGKDHSTKDPDEETPESKDTAQAEADEDTVDAEVMPEETLAE